MVMKIPDGKVAEIDEYADTERVTSAFGPPK
jgi:ketosteroid isomerase-like protein